VIIKWRENSETTHEWDWSGAPKVQEGRWIKERTGWSTKGFLDALEDLDPDAVIALICILSARDGRKLKWDEVDLDPVSDLEFIPTKDELDKVREVEAAEAAARGGKGYLPPAQDLRPLAASSTGQTGNGHLGAAASSHRSEVTPSNSGTASG
jgi:hypothetical protein